MLILVFLAALGWWVVQGKRLLEPSVESVIQSLDARWPWAVHELVKRGDQAEIITALREAAAGTDRNRAAAAEFILFKLRDNPDARLQSLLDRLQSDNPDLAPGRVAELFRHMMEPQDAAYASYFIDVVQSAPEPWIRGVAVAALARMPSAPGVLEALEQAASDSSPEVRADVASALGEIVNVDPGMARSDRTLSTLLKLLSDSDSSVGYSSLEALRYYGANSRSIDALSGMYYGGLDSSERAHALAVLLEVSPAGLRKTLVREALNDPDIEVRSVAEKYSTRLRTRQYMYLLLALAVVAVLFLARYLFLHARKAGGRWCDSL